MSLNPFTWLRRKVAETVVLGATDGFKALFPETEETPADLGELRALLATHTGAKALPAATPEPTAEGEPAKRGRAR